MLCAALLCTAVGRLGLALAHRHLPPTVTILASYPILNLGQGATHTMLKAMMSTAAADGDLGLMLGVLGSVDKGFGVLGPLVGGPAYDHFGPTSPALLASAFALVGAAAAAAIARGRAELSPRQKAD